MSLLFPDYQVRSLDWKRRWKVAQEGLGLEGWICGEKFLAGRPGLGERRRKRHGGQPLLSRLPGEGIHRRAAFGQKQSFADSPLPAIVLLARVRATGKVISR